jgi:hypothetical protein
MWNFVLLLEFKWGSEEVYLGLQFKIVLFSSIGKTNYQNITKTLFKKLLNSHNPKENIQAKFTFKWTSGYKK